MLLKLRRRCSLLISPLSVLSSDKDSLKHWKRVFGVFQEDCCSRIFMRWQSLRSREWATSFFLHGFKSFSPCSSGSLTLLIDQGVRCDERICFWAWANQADCRLSPLIRELMLFRTSVTRTMGQFCRSQSFANYNEGCQNYPYFVLISVMTIKYVWNKDDQQSDSSNCTTPNLLLTAKIGLRGWFRHTPSNNVQHGSNTSDGT